MNAISAGGGMADAQARIASIRARIDQLSPAAPTAAFSLTAAVDPTVAAAGTPVATGAPAVSGASAVLGAPGPSVTGPAPGTTGPATSGGTSTAAARLEQVLPDAGKRWAGPIADAAAKHGVDAGLLAALVRHESNFDPGVRSHAGAIGLGQLMPGTAVGLGVDPTDPAQNLDGAARYLKQQLDRFGSADLALAAYNAGPNRVAQAGGIPNITETRTYVQRVLATWEQYR
ncbi:lytic transglycosylase domain-containing protein [Nitriliruptor alkaliphilus]|uniref:lytic transglycosylase domain-containing protein n=1 Tax=Nitriliruptor alkaliphilus TaxID=427918 RepID=UPI001B802FB5|nr:transglycosylase SLT domain-containing protein [Nitriliruptor alkaliphilus]